MNTLKITLYLPAIRIFEWAALLFWLLLIFFLLLNRLQYPLQLLVSLLLICVTAVLIPLLSMRLLGRLNHYIEYF